jgi:hypothetical protein
MSVSECIEVLFDNSISGLTIIKPPPGQNAPAWVIKAEQGIQTGQPGNQMIVGHQAVGESIVECLNQLTPLVTASAKLKKGQSPILTPGGKRS